MITLIRKKIDVKAPLTDKQMIELENAASMKVVMDDDCPEITDAEFAKFVEMAKKRREEHRKPLVSIRLNPETYAKAKKLGKGYTGILSRLLDMAINNPEMLRKCL